MKNFGSLLAAYLAFWAIVLAYDFSIGRRLLRAQEDLERLKQQLTRS
jgi:HAMP domain-containing protein